jgi:hypothetical protein
MSISAADCAGTGRTDVAQEPKPHSLRAVPLYGVDSWRERNSHLFISDRALRYIVDQNRRALVEAGALVVIGGRYAAVLPAFDQMILEIASQAAGERIEGRRRAIEAAFATAFETDPADVQGRSVPGGVVRCDGFEVVGVPPDSPPGTKPRRLELFNLPQVAEEAVALLRKVGYAQLNVLPVMKAGR